MEQLDKIKQWSRALDGSDYLPGMVSGSLQFIFLLLVVNNCCHEYAKLANVATLESRQLDDVALTCVVHLLEN